MKPEVARKILEVLAEHRIKVTIKHTFGRRNHGGSSTMRGTLDSYGINWFRVFADDCGEPGPGRITFNVEMVTGVGLDKDAATEISIWSPSPG